MSTVEIVIVSTTETNLPAGDTFSGYAFQILNGSEIVQSGAANALNFTFPNDVPPGSYVASVVAVNQTGAAMSTPVTASFTVAAPAQFPAPATITVSVS